MCVSRQREPLDPGLKVAITLRFLATGESYHSLAFSFRVAHNSISLFVPKVCQAIVDEYEDEVFQTPSTPDGWREIADRFSSRWNWHNCCGALDGKHVAIKKPMHSGSLYYNYKGFYSVVLLALVDADYKFVWAEVGANGSSSDAGIFKESALATGLSEGTLGFPDPEPYPKDNSPMPYFIVGDDAFPLRTYLVKPFSARYLGRGERIFNYRCSRARRVVENGFGILVNRFRVLLTTIQTTPNTATLITKACLCMHNLMRMRYPNLQNADLDREGDQGQVIPGAWRDRDFQDEMARAARAPRQTRAGREQRVYMKGYYNSEAGSVPWQEAAIGINN